MVAFVSFLRWRRLGAFVACGLLLQSASRLAGEVNQPAPSEDRVGFPTGYAKTFTILRQTTDAGDATQVTVYGNAPAASIVKFSELPYPNGSVLVMETMRLKKDASGELARDAQGKPVPETVQGLHVMRREAGFGQGYGGDRAGEWEFVEYRADGTYLTPPAKSMSCAACHRKDAGATRDFVFNARFADVK